MKYIALILLSILFITIAPVTASVDSVCEDLTYCTQTMGGWGTGGSGNNVGNLRDTYWDDAVGGDLVIGTGYEMVFTSSQAVEDYLPEGSTAFILDGDETDPDSGTGSVLHGQLTALQLNILFSEAGIGNTGSQSSIADHVINSGPFAGDTVSEFRDFAFQVFGNSTPAGAYSLGDIEETAKSINENYVDCNTDTGYLTPVCTPDPFCGDGEINRPEEQCDGSAPHGFTCNDSCELESEDPMCPLDKNDYDVIVEFDERLRTDLDADDAETSIIPLSLDAGFYSVTLVGHDAYADRVNKYQPNETYVLSFLDGATQIEQSSMHADLLDYVMIAQVTEEVDAALEITSAIDGVKAVHPFYPADSPNSINPVCAGITRNPYCGDDEINQESEECDGSAPEGYTCTDTCELEYVPYCGDGIVNQDSEQCDGESYCDDDCTYLDLTCVEALQAGLVSGSIIGGQATIVNGAPHDYDVGLAVYEKYDEVIANQTIYDSDSDVAPAFGSVDLEVTLPLCAYQIDLFCGDVIQDFGEEGYYGNRKIDWEHNNDAGYCVDSFCGDGIVQEPEQCDGDAGVGENEECSAQCTIVDQCIVETYLVSDAETLADGVPSVLTYDANPAWTAQIENASWIWSSYLVEDPDAAQTVLFSRDFTSLYGNTWLEFDVASDNTYAVLLNGVLVRNETSANNFALSTQDQFSVPTGVIPSATNTIEWIVTNNAGSDTPYANPAGLLYGVRIVTDVCTTPNPYCGDGIINQESEQCDGSAGVADHQSCSSTCQLEDVTYCGDGIKQSPNDELTGGPLDDGYEACDGTDGIGANQECSAQCTIIDLPYCGDGIVQEPEQCDGSAPDGYLCNDSCELIEYCPLPGVNHTYTGPVHENMSVYINTVSRIVIELEEEVSSECIDETLVEYSIKYVADEYCQSAQLCADSEHDIEWSAYEGPFGLDAEGCYIVDYRVSDSNENEAGRACIFHDETPPVLEKIVGEPKEWWNGSNVFYPEAEDWCWSTEEGPECYTLTMTTPITMSCSEEGAEQSGAAKICFEVGVDGDDYTSQYCDTAGGSMENGACCVASDEYTMYFEEESWHKLSFTCTDHVNKTSEADIEYFKVEQGSFEIELNHKWNLISIPIELFDAHPASVFEGLDVAAVWSYENGVWRVWSPDAPSDLDALIPGRGYWVLMRSAGTLSFGGSEFTEASTPPSMPIVHGWNLIGYYGTEGQTSYNGPVGNGRAVSCTLSTLASSLLDNPFPSVITYWEPPNPNQWVMLDENDHMDPGAGYWVFATADGTYARSTSCLTG